MEFRTFMLERDNEIVATAIGHPNEVVTEFHRVCNILLSRKGPWRVTSVVGMCPDEVKLESDMHWTLGAKVKEPQNAGS